MASSRQEKKVIAALAQLDREQFEITANLPPKRENQVATALGSVELYLPLEGLVDVNEERERLNHALIEAKSQADRLEKLLASPFAERAPSDIVQKERDKLAGYQITVANLGKQLKALD